MKILIAADGQYAETHGEAFQRAFRELGHSVEMFTWKEYFKNYPYASHHTVEQNRLKSFYYRFQNRFTLGPAVCALNRDLVKKCRIFQPDLVLIYRGTHIFPRTLKRLKKMGSRVFGYNNDDPFSARYPWHFWRHFRRGIPHYDHIFAYRWKNIEDYKALGYPKASLLRSYYLKDKNFPAEKSPAYACDVLFIGHFEDDGRDEKIKALIEAGVDVKLYGTEWNRSRHFEFFRARFGEIKPLYGATYNQALSSAGMALVFLSKLNNDTYTRRCFEIPATGTAMLCEYTDDLARNLFAPDKEAIYFRDQAELLAKVEFYLAHPKKLAALGQAGYRRVMKDGHEVVHRAQDVLDVYA
jgi:spore maturation protein CgeB